MKIKIYIGADHRGFERKQILKHELLKFDSIVEIEDVGDYKPNPDDDFTEFAQKACLAVLANDSHGAPALAILICGSGQGMAMAANRYRGIRAALPYTEHQAIAAKREEDNNVLCLSSGYLSLEQSINIIKAWVETKFLPKERYLRRISQLDEL
ncbi:MAG TPA: RpiB/LacA/LacB family sugar-phosphate isomerase [Candidatus Saccharibacteria bacterium]|jgi:ribose 5-phosphate isomerase B|nr:RpiB/LacA/LacB family sugar-phosphate isomerase [Candidatus Saccharibacteria bacterium]